MAVFEKWGSHGRDLIELKGDRVCIGKSDHADLVIDDDPAVSRFHALVERVDSHWCIHDLNSTNGTLINGKRLWREQMLRDSDEVEVGRTRLVYRDRAEGREPSTDRLGRAPLLTPRERDVLVELCRPALSGSAFTPPASDREIAERLFVTVAAVKQHLARLYDKFEIPEEAGHEPRRVRVANKALQTGAVTLADLQVQDEPPR